MLRRAISTALYLAICAGVHAQDARIVIRAEQLGRPVSRRLFGANICWPMYTNNLDQETNVASDFLALAPLASQLGLTMLRYPGGLWSDAYRWQRGIGPVSERRGGSPNGTGEGQQPLLGTDEYLRFCEAADMEGIITVNYGLSTTESLETACQEAADWVDYCNSPAGSGKWAALRTMHGHPEPYRVRYWEIGNEIYLRDGHYGAKWGHTDVTTYARRCVAFARAMRAVDPTIKIGAVIHTKLDFVSPNDTKIGSNKPWSQTVLEVAGNDIDFIIPHVYSGGPGGQTALLANNGTVGGLCTATTTGTYTIVARVGGNHFRDAWSHFELRVDETVVADFDTSSKRPRRFEHPLELTAGPHRLSIRFTNDLWVKGEGDRNLHVGGLDLIDPVGETVSIPLVEPQDRLSLCTAVVEEDRARLRALRTLIQNVVPEKTKQIELAVTEWNEMPEMGTLSTALHCASKLMMMAEEGIESAHYWLLFNAVQYRRTELWFPAGPIRLPRPPAFALKIMAGGCLDHLVNCVSTAPELPPLRRQGKGRPAPGKALRALATRSLDGKQLSLIVINRNVSRALTTRVEWTGFSATGNSRITCLTGQDLYDRNEGCTSLDDLRVKPTVCEHAANPTSAVLILPPASLTSLVLTGR
ncbi:MAG: hypothetical protein HN742_04455 [Lentisphaerae bacterium]|jgi:hypothetical protein|nr:hypothetical protein [Lentisphaerota bacterium]MBT4815264.1 hypothetical protein [Lentisphaerota bacterium]MBT5610092.1 hypothetical protein [Lentisphaerota bacterium]MBT7061635.1 hypothetical protein [Lentisphaerota bacterium]MBT7841096.1 hypothetical protein [Lentisphaerota bacterium]